MAMDTTSRPAREMPSAVEHALSRSGLLAFVVDATGRVSDPIGGFAPEGLGGGSLQDVLGAQVLSSALLPALVDTLVSRTPATAALNVAGVDCRALCYPVEGTATQSLVLITPVYEASQSTPGLGLGVSDPSSCDVRVLVEKVRDDLEQHPDRGNEIFAWCEDGPLEVDVHRNVVARLLDLLLDAALSTQLVDGTAVLTARRGDDAGVAVLTMRVYETEFRPAVLRALETVHAEFSAATGIPITMTRTARSLDVVATLGATAVAAASEPAHIGEQESHAFAG